MLWHLFGTIHHLRLLWQLWLCRGHTDVCAVLSDDFYTIVRRDGEVWTLRTRGEEFTVTSREIRGVETFRVLAGYD